VRVTVIVKNQGTAIEIFNVTLYCNVTHIETKTVTNLDPGDQRTLEFEWNTTGLTEASYRIQAQASLVSGETEIDNNAHTGDTVAVSSLTLLQPFDWLTVLPYILVALFGLLFPLGLKLKRKKKTKPRMRKEINAFSQQFGITHQQMKGKKMLFEIDPKSDYNKDLLSFGSEARNNDELLYIITKKNSDLHLHGRIAFSGDSDVKFFLLTSETSSPMLMAENETLLPAKDLSVLLDRFGRIKKVKTKKTINVLFDNVSDVILICGFKKTQKFMHRFLKTVSSSKVTALFAFNPTAHSKKISSSIRDMFQREV
jgi:hypothetical protein